MKFEFFYKGKKKIVQTIKAKTLDDLKVVATVAKCEMTTQSILKDLDCSEHSLLCKVDGEILTMKKLWKFVNEKAESLNSSSNSSKKSNKKKKNNKNKQEISSFNKSKSSKNKKKSKDEKKKKKDKKKKNKSEVKNGRVNFDKVKPQNTDGLIKITRVSK